MEGDEYQHEVPDDARKERADKILARAFPEFSRSRIQQFFEAGLVWCGDEILTKKEKVGPGDVLGFIPPEVKPLDMSPADIPLGVIYEDGDLIAVNKPSGMVTHPGLKTGEDTLVHALLHHCAGELSGIGGVERPGIVHRLDKETSGVIVAAKSDAAFLGLSRMFAEREMEKEYAALAKGSFDLLSGTIREPIGRHPVHRHKMGVVDHGRSARTDWCREEHFGDRFSLLRIQLHTGRTHQIRVHCSWQGNPLAGDTTYGFRASPDETDDNGGPFNRVMLHARRLAFKHPVTGTPLNLEAPWPDDFEAALNFCRERFS